MEQFIWSCCLCRNS